MGGPRYTRRMTQRRTRRLRKLYNRIRRIHRVRRCELARTRVVWRDRQLRPIHDGLGAELLLRLLRPRRVAVTPLPGRGGAHVSTVATIIDQGLGGPPLCFETMARGTGGPLDDVRSITATEHEALRAHADLVAVLVVHSTAD